MSSMSLMSSNVIKEFLLFAKTQNLSIDKITEYENELKGLTDYSNKKEKSVLSLDKENLISYLKSLRSEDRESKKNSQTIAILQIFYQFVVDKNYLQHNPAISLSIPKAWQTMPKFLSKTEVYKLFAQVDIRSNIGIRDISMLQLLYVTGIRVSELITIKLTDIDLTKSTLTYLGKSNKGRDIDLGDAQKYLANYLQIRKQLLGKRNSDMLFVNNYGEELTRQQFWRIIVEYGKSAGLGHITPHMLRHTFATRLLEHGADNVSVEMLSKDESSKTKEPTYIADDRLKSIYQKFHPRSK
ncbi:MAG: tyrosine-type recombinase/integrase [Acidobacteria bacterium]|nr:tyrosine-type recombinase/integrase [Acidobacteriota bacterium]